jgi:UDP-glucose 4-epimerase
MLPRPKSPYAAAKLAQEHYAAAFSTCYGLDTASLRYFNVFGPRQDPTSDYAAVIPKFITLMLAGESPRVDGDGLQTRDFTYVANVVEGNLAAARAGGSLDGEVFNIACGDEISILDLVGTINDLLGTAVEPTHGPSRTGDVRHSRADITRATERLDFRPAVSFEEGLRRTIAFYRGD